MGACSSTSSTPVQSGAGIAYADANGTATHTPQEVAVAKKQEEQRNREIEKKMKDEKFAKEEVNHLLLLGAGESGKSTLFKQMISIYGKGFSEVDRLSYMPIIWQNILASIRMLCTMSAKFGPVAVANEPSRHYVFELKSHNVVTEETAMHIAALWADAGVQRTYESRSKFQLSDSAKYYFDKVLQMARHGYVPTEQDVFRSRQRTTGIVENEFVIGVDKFKMFDVGGQRNERKKWIHCFEGVDSVMFVAALSEYDQTLFEDETTNRMEEALRLFSEICNSRWFKNTSIILFLNKRDILAEKVLKVPLNLCFQDYDGDNSYESAAAYIQMAFESKNRNKRKRIYSHVTCATDRSNVAHVFNAVKDIITRKNLEEGGFDIS